MPDEATLTTEESTELAGYEEAMADTRSWHQPHNQATRDRAQQLYRKQETGIESGNSLGPTAQRVAEIEKLMQDRSGEYWHSETLQAEYRELLEGKPVSDPVAVHAETLATWSESLGLEPEQVADAFSRAERVFDVASNQIDLDLSYDGLSPAVQRCIWRALADPSQRVAQLDLLSDEDFAQLETFLEGMSDAEIAEVEKVLGL